MSEPNQTADSNDSRQESKSRAVTQETLLANLATAEAASEPSDKSEPKEQVEAEHKAKKSPQDRIRELVEKRKEAEAVAEAETKRRQEIEERLRALEAARNAPTEPTDKPVREKFATEDGYLEAISEWKAEQKLIERENKEREARLKAEFEEIEASWNKRLKQVQKDIPDYEEVVSSAAVDIPDFMVMAIKDSEYGPEIVYYLSQNQQEAKRIASMRNPAKALRELIAIERELSATDEPSKPDVKPKQRAPEPINPVKGNTTPNPAPAKTFQEYKARRQAEQRR